MWNASSDSSLLVPLIVLVRERIPRESFLSRGEKVKRESKSSSFSRRSELRFAAARKENAQNEKIYEFMAVDEDDDVEVRFLTRSR